MMRQGEADRPLLVASGLLTVFGLLALYSAGQTDVPTRAAGVWYRQFFWVGLGVLAMLTASRVPPRLLEWAAPLLYGIATLLLVVVLAVGTGSGTAASSKSWIAVGGVKLGQPAELAKVACILLLARHLSGLREPPRTLRDLLKPCLIIGVPFLLVMKQPDLGSALVFVGIFFAMLFWAGVPARMLAFIASPAVSLLLAFSTLWWGSWMVLLFGLIVLWRPFVLDAVIVYLANVAMGIIAIPLWEKLAPYQQNRLLTFLNPEVDPQRAGYHAIQSKVAIGSAGLFGKGLTQGPQKRLAFLPEQHTDFIFSVVGEELGFLGVAIALALFLYLFTQLLRIARRASDPFASLVAFGVLGLLFTHVFENVGMTVNLMPITGIPLPFFSFGGSFFVVVAGCLGLVLRVAADSRATGAADI
ncbi:MAG: rod shape-determining protein RodA [Gemmatimonadales bacterium]|nr:rod shape-determining protein RodA [Gemmatimonadales bacterium]